MLCRIIENRGRKWLKVMLELILGCGLNPDGVCAVNIVVILRKEGCFRSLFECNCS